MIALGLLTGKGFAADEHEPDHAVRFVSLAESGLSVSLGEPVVVAVSKVGENRWGHHQFPKLSPLPDGGILLTYNASADDNAAYGKPGPAHVSGDGGRSWQPYAGKEQGIAISHSPISAVGGGEFLCLPFAPGIDLRRRADMPKPVGEYFCYAKRYYYRLDACPDEVRRYATNLQALRWTPRSQRWQKEVLQYEPRDALVWTSEQSNGSILSRNSFEYPLLRFDGELFTADYKGRYLRRDGSVPRGMVVTCMASKDNGRTFERRGTIAEDPAGKLHPSETAIAAAADRRLVCIGRASCETTRPMWISFSSDRGKTWTERKEFYRFGVMPVMGSLPSGTIALAFGRPGVHLSFSPDGSASTWTEPLAIVPKERKTCGYCNLLVLSKTSFLLAYSDFEHRGEQGKRRKAILVRQVSIRRD